jgi:hypothetical protein
MNDYVKRNEPGVNFLGEQDGSPERRLKTSLRRRFTEMRTVERAYLARVRYGTGRSDVALALVTRGNEKDSVVKSVHEEFHALFNASQHLDIMFLTAVQESEICLVCPPFFLADR